ncbi:MAG: M56/M15 family metallopeptidase [Ferruginibacter sp.]
MPVFAFSILKIIACSGILLGYYWLALRNRVYHQYNRFYLLAITIISLLIPFIEFNIWQQPSTKNIEAINLLQVITSGNDYLDEVILAAKDNAFTTTQWITLLYTGSCCWFLLVFINSLLKIARLYRKNKSEKFENIHIVHTTAPGTPFSFLKYIFWNSDIDINSVSGHQVFIHELTHVRQKHTLDKLFMGMVLIFLWCNPFYWLIRKELEMIHEFIADEKAVDGGSEASFAAMVLQAAYPKQQFTLTNPFFYSPIKRRIAMITKNKQSKAGSVTRVLALPLLLFVITAFTLKSKFSGNNQFTRYTGEPVTVVIDAGHGGKDFGAVSTNGSIYEKDVVLAITKKVKALNSNSQINIILTREDDVYQTPQEKVTFAKQKNAALFISIHLDNDENKTGQSSGLNVFVAKDGYGNAGKSKLLASALINQFSGKYALPVAANPQQKKNGIWVLQANDCPAVLIEAGFISNENDLAYIQSSAGMDQAATNILNAVESYMQAVKK